jgi:hypothetical protein
LEERQVVTPAQFEFAIRADESFATQDIELLSGLSRQNEAPILWVPAAAARLPEEFPNPKTGLGKLEALVLKAVKSGIHTPGELFKEVAKADSLPQWESELDLMEFIIKPIL